MDQLIKDYQHYLQIKRLSKATVKNYVSDVKKFLHWLKDQPGVEKDKLVSQVTSESMEKYKAYLTSKNVPAKTVNRQFSSLRSFGQFMQREKLLMASPAQFLENIPRQQVIKEDPLLDSQQKITRLEERHKKVLPILIAILVLILLLLGLGIYVYIRSNKKAREAEIFIQEEGVSLPVKETEPVYEIDPQTGEKKLVETGKYTCDYCLNARALQGHTPSASGAADKVPLITETGDFVLGEPDPNIISTSGTLGIGGAGLNLTTTTASDGDITLAPDGAGALYAHLNSTSGDHLRITNANISSGALVSAYAGNSNIGFDLLRLGSGVTEIDRFRVTTEGDLYLSRNATVSGSLQSSSLLVRGWQTDLAKIQDNAGTDLFVVKNNGNIGISQYLYHLGDEDTYLNFEDDSLKIDAGGVNFLHFTENSTQDVLAGNEANADVDFSWNSDNYNYLLYANAGTDRVGIGTNEPNYKLDVRGGAYFGGSLHMAGHVLPNADNNYDLGSSTYEWRDLYVDGTANIDTASIDSLTMNGNLDMNNNLILNIGAAGTDFTTGGGLNLAGTFDADGQFTLGDGGDTGAIDTSDWDISTTGNMTGIGNITMDGNLTVADNSWLGLGADAGRIEFDNQATDEVNILDSRLGVGTSTPQALVHIGSAGTPGSIDGTDDLYVYDDLEVDGMIYGTVSGTIDPGFVQGSVAFQGASGLTSDPANFFWHDGSNYLGIGTSNPSVSLEVVGEIRGTRFAFQDDPDTYIDTLSSNKMVFVTGGNNQVVIDSNGNVGIGTTNPSSFKLEVDGSIGPTADDSYDLGSNTRRWQDLYLGPGTIHLGTSTSDEATLSYNTSTNDLIIDADADIILDPSANAGIGTTGPSSRLSIAGGVGIGTTSPASLYHSTALAPDGGMIIEGNVGIGTTGPGAALDINGNVILGNTAGHTITFTGKVNSDIVANNNSWDIGSASTRWSVGYFDTINANNLVGVVVTGSTSSYDWLIGAGYTGSNDQIITLTFERGTPIINAVMQWNASGDASRVAGYDDNFLFNFPVSVYSQVSGGSQTFTSGSIFNYGQNATHAITQSAAFVGLDVDLSSNITIPDTVSGNQTGVLLTLKDGGASATSIGLDLDGTADLGIDLSGATINTDDIKLSNSETINNTTNSELAFSDGTNTLTMDLDENSSGAIDFSTNGSVDITFNPGGNVGIGTTSPGYKLEVNGAGYVSGNLGIGGTATIANIPLVSDNNRVLTSASAGSGAVQYLDTSSWDKDTSDDFSAWVLAGDGGTPQSIGSGNTATLAGGIGIGTTASATDTLTIDVDQSYAFGWTGNQTWAGTATFNSTLSGTSIVNLTGLGTGTDDTVLILDGSNNVTTDEIDSRVWGSSLVDGSGLANHIGYWSDENTLTYDPGEFYWDPSSNYLGIGTSSPSSALHVIGECVAEDTFIPVAGDNFQSSILNFQSIYNNLIFKQIKEVSPGDYILSLNEKTGSFEWQRVEKALDKGIQEVFELITESGKRIETTGNHPYLARNSAANQSDNQKPSAQGENDADNEQGIHNLVSFSNENINKNNNNRCQNRSPGSGRKQVIHLDPFNKCNENNNKKLVQATATNPDLITASNTCPVNIGAIIPAPNQATPRLAQNSANNLRCSDDNSFTENNLTHADFPVNQSSWRKVVYLQPGMEIGVLPDYYEGSDSEAGLAWERIVSIEKKGRKHVYDLQIENTHNFVANGIVAHNTYISGNVGIGTTGPGYKLEVNGDGYFSGNLGIGGTATIANIPDLADNNVVLTTDSGVIKYLDTSSWDKDTSDDFSAWGLAGDGGTPQSIGSGNTATLAGGIGIGTTASATDTLTIDVDQSYAFGWTGNQTWAGTATFNSTLSGTSIVNLTGLGTGTDDTVLILDGSNNVTTDEIDSRVWGSSLVDYSSSGANYLAKFSDGETITSSIIYESSSLVGIGTTAPGAKLQIHNNSGSAVAMFLTNSDTGTTSSDGFIVAVYSDESAYIWNRENTAMRFATNNQEQMRIDNSGSVGIGTTGPGYTLDVIGSARAGSASNYTTVSSGGDLSFGGTGDYLVGGNDWAFRYSGNENYGLYFNLTNSSYDFTGSSGTAVFTLKTAGNLGIGTTDPGKKLDVAGDIRLTGSFYDTNVTGGIALGDGSNTALDDDFSATSIIGALNELIRGPVISLTWGDAGTHADNEWYRIHNGTAATTGYELPYAGIVENVSARCDTAPTAEDNVELYIDGAEKASCQATISTVTGDIIQDCSESFSAGSYISMQADLPAGGSGSNCQVVVILRFNSVDYDLAEYFPTQDMSIEWGDVVEINRQYPENIQKSSQANSSVLLGVISTQPSVVMGDWAPDRRPVALNGRVPVKISPSSAPILAGDFLTSSSEPGMAQKSTRPGVVIGKALEPWTPESGKKKIITYINISWHDPDVYLTSTGELQLKNDQLPNSNEQNLEFGAWSLVNSTGEIIKRIGAFAELASAKIKAGLIQTTSLIAENISAEKSIISPLVQTDNLIATTVKTKMIKPAADSDLIINLDQNDKKLRIQNQAGIDVAQIDDQGNADFAGVMESEAVKTKSLSAREATISGDLKADKGFFSQIFASKIDADLIEGLEAKISSISAKNYSWEEDLEADDSDLLALASTWTNQTEPIDYLDISSIDADSLMINEFFAVFGQAVITNLEVTDGLVIQDKLRLTPNSIGSIEKLYIQPLGLQGIDIMAGALTIDEKGDVYISGNLIVGGKIASQSMETKEATVSASLFANLIKPLDQLTIELDSTKSAKLAIKNKKEEVASIDASGSATFRKINIASAEATPSGFGEIVPEINTNATAGKGVLKANSKELVIHNRHITKNSLIYITPTSDTSNKVLYVKNKKDSSPPAGGGYFTVSIDTAISKEIEFNWWIIN